MCLNKKIRSCISVSTSITFEHFEKHYDKEDVRLLRARKNN